jgi:hypothetical protein
MMKISTYPLLLVLMGSMDCLTTVIGIAYFGAVEVNPLLAGIANRSLMAFVVLKLATTVVVCLFFVQAEKILMKTENKKTRAFSYTRMLLKIAYLGVIVFLAVVVTNNIIVLVRAI